MTEKPDEPAEVVLDDGLKIDQPRRGRAELATLLRDYVRAVEAGEEAQTDEEKAEARTFWMQVMREAIDYLEPPIR